MRGLSLLSQNVMIINDDCARQSDLATLFKYTSPLRGERNWKMVVI